QLVDEGYMEIDLLVASRNKGVDLVGPVPSSKSWQDRTEGAFDHTQFHIDWEKRLVTCPQGKTSVRCSERKSWRGTPSLVFVFDTKDCLLCPVRKHCTRAKNVGRTLTLYPQEQYEAQLQARKRQQTASAAAPNFARLFEWVIGERPKETRTSPFLALAAST
ncbi:MAG TPA: transposase, partial [Anaerolineales bacterium]|nr:transposase [Anaerolineales bacterium]